MGQKINPKSFRTGINKNWSSRWFFALPPEKTGKKGSKIEKTNLYAKFLAEDELIRHTIEEKISQAGIASMEIERTASSVRVFIKAARPGLIIGRGGKGVEDLTKAIDIAIRKVRKEKQPVPLSVNIEELKRTEISAQYTAQQIAWDLERRMKTRRTMKKYLDLIGQNREAKGAKILVSGRVDGNEIARREVLKFGALPLQNLRADIDYGQVTAHTSFGTIGIKVWIYKGEIFEGGKKNNDKK
jgi:small subunit ribosomal protein S3